MPQIKYDFYEVICNTGKNSYTSIKIKCFMKIVYNLIKFENYIFSKSYNYYFLNKVKKNTLGKSSGHY